MKRSFLIIIVFFFSFTGSYSQEFVFDKDNQKEIMSIPKKHLNHMLDFLIDKQELALKKEYIFENIYAKNQAFFLAKRLKTQELGVYSYVFCSTASHGAYAYILIINKNNEELILGSKNFTQDMDTFFVFLDRSSTNEKDKFELFQLIEPGLVFVYKWHFL